MNSGPRTGEGVPLIIAARRARLTPRRVREAVRIGLVRPIRAQGGAIFFSEPEVGRLRRIRRLREDLGLNTAGVEIVLRLLDEIEALSVAEPRPRRRITRTESGGQEWR